MNDGQASPATLPSGCSPQTTPAGAPATQEVPEGQTKVSFLAAADIWDSALAVTNPRYGEQ